MTFKLYVWTGFLIPAVTTGQVDCVIAGQSITSERLQAVDYH